MEKEYMFHCRGCYKPDKTYWYNDEGQKGHLVLEYKSYFENTFVLDYQELGK